MHFNQLQFCQHVGSFASDSGSALATVAGIEQRKRPTLLGLEKIFSNGLTELRSLQHLHFVQSTPSAHETQIFRPTRIF